MLGRKKLVIDPTKLPGSDNAPASGDEIYSDQQEKKELEEEGQKEAHKDSSKEESINKKKFEDLIDSSHGVLFKLKNVIPIFTSELIIDTNKVTVIHRPFIFSERIHSVSIQDISDVFIDTVPFLATISIVDRDFVDNVVSVRWVNVLSVRWIWKTKAERARRIIMGLMEVEREEIDITKIEGTNLLEKLEGIGKVRQTKTTVSKA